MDEDARTCPFCGETIHEGETFICPACIETRLGTMSEGRRRNFLLLQNPWSLSPAQTMSPGERQAFDAILTATQNVVQHLVLLDPGDADNAEDRNPHTLVLDLPLIPIAAPPGDLEKTVDAAIEAARTAHQNTQQTRERAHHERLENEAREANEMAAELANLARAGIPVEASEIASARLRAKHANTKLQTPANPTDHWPFLPTHTIQRLFRTREQITMAMAIKFPGQPWEGVYPIDMAPDEYTERERILTEAAKAPAEQPGSSL